MTGASAAEKEIPGSKADKLHRGRNVVLAFTMQVSPFTMQVTPFTMQVTPFTTQVSPFSDTG